MEKALSYKLSLKIFLVNSFTSIVQESLQGVDESTSMPPAIT